MGRKSKRQFLAEIMAEIEAKDGRRRRNRATRVANGTAAKPRPKCNCDAYPFPHRPAGGKCRFPDPPAELHPGAPGTHAPLLLRRQSTIRRHILSTYGMHPIKDRQRVVRWLPKL